MHTNSIDYNEQLDQILISVCYFNEIWVIDHRTTTLEAAGHTGGNSGKGGDLLYRWGNPQVYDRGTASNQKLFLQHDATWIDEGCPGEGNILVFNNEVNHHSSVDEIVPPINNSEYYIEENNAYGPVDPTWSYTDTGFYAGQFGGAIRLASGNTLITNGETGNLFEVTPEKTTIWQYKTGDQLFKAVYIPPEEPPGHNVPDLDCSGSLSWSHIKPGATVNGSFQVQNIGGNDSLLNWTINTSSISWGTWSFTAESGENLTPKEGQVTVQVSVITPNEENSEFEGYLRVENRENSTDFDIIPVYLKTPVNNVTIVQIIIHSFLVKLKQLHVLFEKIFNLL